MTARGLPAEWGFGGYEAISKGVFCPAGGGQIILSFHSTQAEELEQYND